MNRLAISLLPIGALIFGQAWGAEEGQFRARIEALEGLVATL